MHGKNDYYTKTLQFNDINYELAGTVEQEAIFNRYCSFLNHFESNIDIQFTFQNKVIDMKEFKKYIKLPYKKTNLKKSKNIGVSIRKCFTVNLKREAAEQSK